MDHALCLTAKVGCGPRTNDKLYGRQRLALGLWNSRAWAAVVEVVEQIRHARGRILFNPATAGEDLTRYV
jgi:hypothetical protein